MSSNLNSGNPVVGYRRPNQAYAAPGTLTNDIQLNRGDELLILDRERQDQQEKILEQATTIRNLQLHGRYHFEILNKRGSSFDFWYGEQSSSLLTRVLFSRLWSWLLFLCFCTVSYLEKQLQRAVMLNPSLADDLNKGDDAPGANDGDKPIDENAN